MGPDGVVVVVSPTGFAWRDGIRPGQVVIRLDDSMAPGGWRLETSADGNTVIARAAPWDAALRDSLPLGVAAMVLGGLAVVFLRGHRSWAPAAACTALLLAAPVLALHGRPEASTIALGAAAAVPAYWLAWRPRLPIVVSVLATLQAEPNGTLVVHASPLSTGAPRGPAPDPARMDDPRRHPAGTHDVDQHVDR